MKGNENKPSKITLEDLLFSNQMTIAVKDAAEVLEIGSNSALKMVKEQRFPFVDCVVKVGGETGKGQYKILRIKFIKNITGENYEEQVHHKNNLLNDRNKNTLFCSEEEKIKIDKIINTIG